MIIPLKESHESILTTCQCVKTNPKRNNNNPNRRHHWPCISMLWHVTLILCLFFAAVGFPLNQCPVSPRSNLGSVSQVQCHCCATSTWQVMFKMTVVKHVHTWCPVSTWFATAYYRWCPVALWCPLSPWFTSALWVVSSVTVVTISFVFKWFPYHLNSLQLHMLCPMSLWLISILY